MLGAAYHAWVVGAMSLGAHYRYWAHYRFKICFWRADEALGVYFGFLCEMPMSEKILVMDKQDKVRRYFSDILTGEGYLVVTTDNMADGLRLMQSEAPDLVIVDARLPIGDCLHQLHDNNKLESAVDLIVTVAEADRDAAAPWLVKGVYDCLPKPVTPPHLLSAAVGRAMQKRRLVFENRRLAEQLEQASIKDPLTGLFNHRHMYNRLTDEIVRGSRYNRPFLLVVADIDGFRRLNETCGRNTGDLVLTHVARLLEGNLRLADSVFRYEGGKFVLLLPETRMHQGIRVAERILEGARYHVFACGEDNPRVTINMGAAEFPLEARDVPSLIELAGQRLRGAKAAGGEGFQFEDPQVVLSEFGY
jgi:two-component system, cell cycle response regulator